ncbi:MAG: hypothetical protein Q9219_005198 [cf. Caloplaca sp. 3 TL-2023]
MAPQPSQADIIFNRANVALAKTQRLVASWLPPPTEDEVKNAKTEAEIEREEQEIFTPVPELLGLGAKPIEVGVLKREKLGPDEVLRRQLLGRNYAKVRNNRGQLQDDQKGAGAIRPVGSKPRPEPPKCDIKVDSSGDEGGRSSLGKRKHRDILGLSGGGGSGFVQADDVHAPEKRPKDVKKPAKAINYLDEVLSQKRKRHKSKKRKKKAPADGKKPDH